MKKLSLLILILLTPMLLMAQKVIVKGDMNDDGNITTADVTKVVDTALGKEPIVKYVIDPNMPDSSALAGSWRTHEGAQIEFGTDGTVTSTEYTEAKTYEYFPYRGHLLLYNDSDKTIPIKIFHLFKKTDTYLILCPQGTDNNVCYYSGNTFIGSIELAPSALSLRVGDKETISADVTPSTALKKNLKWGSSDPSVATVDQMGNVAAVGKGNCTITVSSTDGTNITKSCDIIVTQPVTGISLSTDSLKLWPKGSGTLTAEITPLEASNRNVIWESSDTTIAIVNDGIVTAKVIGECNITCTAADGSGIQAVCAVKVEEKELIRVEEITISENAITLIPGKNTQLSVTKILPENADSKDVKWTTNNPDVAIVGEKDGNVTAVGVGTCKISCSALDGSGTTVECEVKVVKNAVTNITLNHTNIELHLEDNLSLEATILPIDAEVKDVIWTTSYDTIATVDSTGLVKAKSEGVCTITCISVENEEIKAMCDVKVTKSEGPILINEIKLSQNSLSLNLKDKDTLKTVSIIPTNAESLEVIWSSNNEKVATVDQNGNITAVAPGTCNITCAAKNASNVNTTCTVTVNPIFKDHEFVDLGFTDASGKPIYWATCNVGAETPQEYGNYFAWGETEGYLEGKSDFSWDTYKFGKKNALTKYCFAYNYGVPDQKLTLESSDDAATTNWGEGWRMPTDDDLTRLRNNCWWDWKLSYNGMPIKGYLVTSKFNDAQIFLPVAGDIEGNEYDSTPTGYYWSSTLCKDNNENQAYCILMTSAIKQKMKLDRCIGMTIRPVCQ